jgi:hypothetical protein
LNQPGADGHRKLGRCGRGQQQEQQWRGKAHSGATAVPDILVLSDAP